MTPPTDGNGNPLPGYDTIEDCKQNRPHISLCQGGGEDGPAGNVYWCPQGPGVEIDFLPDGQEVGDPPVCFYDCGVTPPAECGSPSDGLIYQTPFE